MLIEFTDKPTKAHLIYNKLWDLIFIWNNDSIYSNFNLTCCPRFSLHHPTTVGSFSHIFSPKHLPNKKGAPPCKSPVTASTGRGCAGPGVMLRGSGTEMPMIGTRTHLRKAVMLRAHRRRKQDWRGHTVLSCLRALFSLSLFPPCFATQTK